ncbi:MAG TPA: peptidoglycan DD-metalloendopeptidase family protein [Candidatus Paceibacterota bacterium]
MLSSKHARLLVILVACIFICAPLTRVVRADSQSDIQAQIDDRTQKIQDIQNEIAALQKQLDATSNQKLTLQGTLKSLDLANRKLVAQISLTQTQISRTDLQIRTLTGSIATTSDHIQTSNDSVAGIMRDLDNSDQSPVALTLLSGGTLSSMFDELATLSATRDTLRGHVQDLSTLKTQLTQTRTAAQQKRDELAALKLDLTQQKQALAATIADKNTLLSQTKNKESNYQALIAQKKEQEAEFEQELNTFQDQLKGVVDTSTLPSTGHGILQWPLASIRITQYFGNTAFATQNPQIYNGHGHSGVDFAASPGTRVMSAGSGVVLGTGNTDLTCPSASYGKWVLVKHNNGLTTLYAHLSVISVSQGQSVGVGQVVGYSGSTGYATGPHLHFAVFASDVVQISSFPSKSCRGRIYTMPVAPLSGYLNPLSYL